MATTESSRPFDQDLIERVVQWYKDYQKDRIGQFVQHYPKEKRVFEVVFDDLQRGLRDVADLYLENPDRCIDLLTEALELCDLPIPVELDKAQVRVVGLEDAVQQPVRDVGEFVPSDLDLNHELLRGQVVKKSKSKPRSSKIVFECQRCTGTTAVPQPPNDLVEPHECQQCERQGPFRPDQRESLEHATDWQVIRIQEPPEKAAGNSGADIDIELTEDLVNDAEPGDRVLVSTEINAMLEDDEPVFELQGMAKSLETLESDFDSIDVEEHRETVEELAEREDVHELFIDSIAPAHYGDRELKEAIAYSLFGGVPKDQGGNAVRGSIHIFMVGDPGCGKSELLQYVNDITPRSIYTSGAGSTAAGLTCAAMKDDFGDGGWTLEAGALVEADKGVACIDELDDMDEEDRSGMLEAMSEQQISASKAGINATMPARTTVLAAANPKHGRYDTYEPIAEQIDVHPALITRFDLIFTMQDEPDMERDSKIAERQLTDPDDIEPAIDPETLRAFVAMGREIDPELTQPARDRIKQEYNAFRQVNDEDGPIPITPRMVESMERLTQASARVRLSDTATVTDVERALSIYKSWLEDVGVDHETGDLDVDIVETGQSTTQRKRAEAILSTVRSMEEEFDSGAPEDVVVDTLADMDEYDRDKVRHTLQNLRDQGEVYEPQTGHLRTTE